MARIQILGDSARQYVREALEEALANLPDVFHFVEDAERTVTGQVIKRIQVQYTLKEKDSEAQDHHHDGRR